MIVIVRLPEHENHTYANAFFYVMDGYLIIRPDMPSNKRELAQYAPGAWLSVGYLNKSEEEK
jgi:hypothetical protein